MALPGPDRIRAGRDRWQEALDAIESGVVLLDDDGRVARCNPAFARILGLSPAEVAGRPWRSLLEAHLPHWLDGDPYPRSLQALSPHCSQLGHAGRWYSVRVSPVVSRRGRGPSVTGAVCILSDVTERHEAVETTLGQGRTFRALVENSPDWISRIDRELRFVYANPAVERAFGLRPASILRKTIRRLPLPEDYAWGWETVLRKVFATGEEEALEFALPVAGEDRYFHARVVPEHDSGGAVESVLAIGRDITELKRAQEDRERLEADNRLQGERLTLLAAQKSALASVGAEVNGGKSLPEILQRTLTRTVELLGGYDGSVFLFEPDGRHLRGAVEIKSLGRSGMVIDIEEWPGDKRAVETGKPVYFTLPETRSPATEWFRILDIWGCLAAPLMVDERCIGLIYVNYKGQGYSPAADDFAFAESVAGQCSLTIDRARAHEERARLLAREQEARAAAEGHAQQMRALFKSLAEGVTVVDAKGRVLLRNEAAAEITGVAGLEGQQVCHHPAAWRLLGLDRTPLPSALYPARRLLRGEPLGEVEYILERADGTWRRVVCAGGTVRDERGRVALAVMTLRDVTSLRQLEAAKDDYLQVLAHELCNPLAAAMGLVQLVARRLGVRGDRRCQEYLALAESELDRLNGLIADIITGYRVSGGHLPLDLGPVDLVDVLAQALRPYSLKAHRHRFIVSPPPSPEIVVIGDARRLIEVISNLLSNAIKYSPSGRSIWISVAIQNGNAVVRVEDEGIGIPPDQLEKVFEGFYRATNLTNRQPGGLGLGLYISRDMARRHGGDLWAANRPGGGTAMCLKLPLAPT